MMRPPVLAARIERRLLVNYRVDPDRAQHMIPERFRPVIVAGHAVAGVCLIRLGDVRLPGLPRFVGLRSENAAHRIAVEWDDDGGTHTGVYIPRRDSGALANVFLGGRVFPGVHHYAHFDVHETATDLDIAFRAHDGAVAVDASVAVSNDLAGSELFPSLADASAFFEHGCVGMSATRDGDRADAVELCTSAWKVEPVTVKSVHSSLFDDPARFPAGTATLDCALLMRNVPVAWRAIPSVALSGG
jgi:hypothetical protein